MSQLTLVFFYEGKSITIQCQEDEKIDDVLIDIVLKQV